MTIFFAILAALAVRFVVRYLYIMFTYTGDEHPVYLALGLHW